MVKAEAKDINLCILKPVLVLPGDQKESVNVNVFHLEQWKARSHTAVECPGD